MEEVKIRKRFHYKLFLVMILFASTIAFITLLMNQNKIRDEILENNQIQLSQIEDLVLYSLQITDKINYHFDHEAVQNMEESEFNVLQTIQELERQYAIVDDIHILNFEGLPLDKSAIINHLTPERREVFKHALRTFNTVENREVIDGKVQVFRYIPYESAYADGLTNSKVVEIVYNENELTAVLKENKRNFIIQLTFILAITIIISLLISNWVSEPMYLAFHDSMTGLYNRAAFEERVQSELMSGNRIAIMLMDLDNFKMVNDHLGHAEGDKLLRAVAKVMLPSKTEDYTAYRFGGDEFSIIVSANSINDTEKIAADIIYQLKMLFDRIPALSHLQVSASIGISYFPYHAKDLETLYEKADMALYESKRIGKSRYSIYNDRMQPIRRAIN